MAQFKIPDYDRLDDIDIYVQSTHGPGRRKAIEQNYKSESREICTIEVTPVRSKITTAQQSYSR